LMSSTLAGFTIAVMSFIAISFLLFFKY